MKKKTLLNASLLIKFSKNQLNFRIKSFGVLIFPRRNSNLIISHLHVEDDVVQDVVDGTLDGRAEL